MKKKGFTLVELLSIIIILGRIALIAVPIVTNIVEESKQEAFNISLQNLDKNIEENCLIKKAKLEERKKIYIIPSNKIPNIQIRVNILNIDIYVL